MFRSDRNSFHGGPNDGPRFPRSVAKVLAYEVVSAVMVALVISLTFLTLPRVCLTNGMESSWAAVLSYAHQKGLQFGTDLVYTYGPLGFLTISYYTGDSPVLRMVFDCAFCFGIAAGVCLLAWRLNRGWRFLTIALFTLMAANFANGAQDLLINLGLLCWGLLCISEGRPRLSIYVGCLVLLAIFSALAKVTGLVLGSLTIAVVVIDLWIRGYRPLGVAAGQGFLIGFFLGWMVAGQQLSHIPEFLVRGLAISGGYASAMGVEVNPVWLIGALLTLCTAAGAILARYCGQDQDAKQCARQRVVFAWLLALLFISWKHGFTRADGQHMMTFLKFTPVMALVLGAVPWAAPKHNRASLLLAGACCLCAIVTLQWPIFPEFLQWDRPFHRAGENLASVFSPRTYLRQMDDWLRLERHRADLPQTRERIGGAPVDVFGNYQTYAVLNEFNYRPRPVFQSYAAYSPKLMSLNERFYASAVAPQFVLTRLGAVDGRLPVLEDASAFRHLLLNYQVAAEEAEFLLLKSKANDPAKLNLLREDTIRLGEPIALPDYGQAALWLEIDVRPTVLGRLRNFFYQPSQVRLSVWDGSPACPGKSYRAPPPMLAAGFLASPLVLSNDDMRHLYAGQKVARPAAYSVEIAPVARMYWEPSVRYRIYRIENWRAASHSS